MESAIKNAIAGAKEYQVLAVEAFNAGGMKRAAECFAIARVFCGTVAELAQMQATDARAKTKAMLEGVHDAN